MAREQHRFALPKIWAAVRGLFLLVALLSLIATTCAPVQGVSAAGVTPTIASLSIREAPNDLDANLTITGTGFTTPLTVKLGSTTLYYPKANPAATQIQVTVRWGMTPGVYDLSIVNKDGQQALLEDAFTVRPGLNTLTSEGPYGGGALELEIYKYDANVVLADMGYAGLFRTLDGGENWEPIFQPADYFASLELDPTEADIAYITREGDGLYRTLEASYPKDMAMNPGQITWEKLNLPLTGVFGHARTFAHPRKAGVVFAVTYQDEAFCDYFDCALYRSNDSGGHWAAAPAPKLGDGSTAHLLAMAFHPTLDDTFYASTTTHHILKTTDGGATWTDLGIAIPHDRQMATELFVPPTAPDTVWAYGMDSIDHGEGQDRHQHYLVIYENGQWVTPEDVLPPGHKGDQICKILYDTRLDQNDPAHTERIMVVSAAGIYTSTDGGASLNLLSDKMKGPCGSIALDPFHWNFFFTSYNQRGVFRTYSDGQSYEHKSKGLTGFVVNDLRVSPQDPATVYATAQDVALFKTTNGGGNWHELPVSIWPGAISPLAADLTTDGRLYLGSFFSYYTAVNGGEAQADWQMTGFNWNDATAHPDLMPAEFSSCQLREASAVAVAKGAAPGGKDRIFMGIAYHGFWYPDPQNPTCQDGKQVPGMVIYASDDQGAHWTRAFTETNNYFPFTIQVDPADPKRIFVGATDSVDNKYEIARVYYSLDGGATWQNSGETYTNRLPFITVGKNHTLLTAFGAALASSSDNGKTWKVISETDAMITKIAYDPAVYELYIGTYNGVRVSYDDGKTWKALPGSLGQANITALAVRQAENRTIIYASTPGRTIGGQAASAAPNQLQPAAAANPEGIAGGVYRYTVTTSTTYLPILSKPASAK